MGSHKPYPRRRTVFLCVDRSQLRRDEQRNGKFFLKTHDDSLEAASYELKHYAWPKDTLKKCDNLDTEESGSSNRVRSMDVSGRGDYKKKKENLDQKRMSSNEDSRKTKNRLRKETISRKCEVSHTNSYESDPEGVSKSRDCQ